MEDFNNLIDIQAEQVLVPLGFQKSGVHYIKKESASYYALIKRTDIGIFKDYFLVYSHESAGDIFKELLKKPSVMLKDYLLSVYVDDLEIIYSNCSTLIDSSYNFHSLARQFRVNSKCKESEDAFAKKMLENMSRDKKLYTEEEYHRMYIKNLFDLINKFGIRFFNDCNFNLCYTSIKRQINIPNIPLIKDQLLEIYKKLELYKNTNRIEITGTKMNQNWFSRILKK